MLVHVDQKVKTPKHCKGCKSLHLGGVYGPWCCSNGKRADKSIGHCINTGMKREAVPSWKTQTTSTS